MFWPLILPFQITAVLIGGLVTLAIAYALIKGKHRLKIIAWSIISSIVVFIPSCWLIEKVLTLLINQPHTGIVI